MITVLSDVSNEAGLQFCVEKSNICIIERGKIVDPSDGTFIHYLFYFIIFYFNLFYYFLSLFFLLAPYIYFKAYIQEIQINVTRVQLEL